LHIVRCFDDEDVVHVAGAIDPIQDIEIINLELILSDLQSAENILARLEKQSRGRKDLAPVLDCLKRVKEHLNTTKPLRLMELSEEEKEYLSPYPFLTSKPVLYIANVGEEDLPEMENPYVQKVREYAESHDSCVVPICAKLEEEIAQLSEGDRLEFLESVGLHEAGLDRLIKESFTLLGLINYMTTGEIETRAWTIPKGTEAAVAAGKIHSDIQKGFIRAEVVSYADMLEYKGRVGAREQGKARSEGREYLVKDGDVILFYHN